MTTRFFARLYARIVAIAAPVSVVAQGSPVERELQAPGARVTLPVDVARHPFPRGFVTDAQNAFSSFHAQMGGDHTLYYLLNIGAILRTDMAAPNPDFKPLELALNPDIGDITVTTEIAGPLSLNDYLAHSGFRTQGLLMLHKGKVVYESYPGMSPTDVHFWASASKPLTGLIAAMLIEDGKIDPAAPVTAYVDRLTGTAWDRIRVIDVINHTSGLDIEETPQAILDPQSMFVRFVYAAMGVPDRSVVLEDWVEILREARPLPGEGPGDRYRYSSLNTQVLALVIEEVADLRWTDVLEQRIWGKLGARMPLFAHLAPDGTALAMGVVSSTLRDMGRFGVLFTPSWPTVADKQVVTSKLLDRIRSNGDPKAFHGSVKEDQAMSLFGEPAIKGSYQFDFIFADGAMYKNGNLGQGLYVDPERDFVGVFFSTTPYVPPYGESKAPAYLRAAARFLAGD